MVFKRNGDCISRRQQNTKGDGGLYKLNANQLPKKGPHKKITEPYGGDRDSTKIL